VVLGWLLRLSTIIADVTDGSAATITAGLLVRDRIATEAVTCALADGHVTVSTLTLCVGSSVEFAALTGAGLAISAGRVNFVNAHSVFLLVLIMRCVWLVAIRGSAVFCQN
jgi:hypothetical protein